MKIFSAASNVAAVALSAYATAFFAPAEASASATAHQSLRAATITTATTAARELLSPPLNPPLCVREDNTDFTGNDLANAPGQVGDCCAHCDNLSACAAWSWSAHNGGTCWLKRGRGAVVASAGVTSGVKFGRSELYPCADLEYNADYEGYDVGNVRMLKPQDCCSECQRFPGCKVFTHTTHNGGTCWLKSQRGRMVYNADASSSLAYGSSAVVPSCGLEAGVDYVGNDIGSATAARPDECCAKCQAFAGCRAFSWTTQGGGTCYFKNRKDGTVAKAGVTSCAVLPNPRAPSCVMQKGVDYVGNDMGNAPSADPYGCCSICMKTAGCKAFSWTNQSGGTCWLKSDKGATIVNANVHSSVV